MKQCRMGHICKIGTSEEVPVVVKIKGSYMHMMERIPYCYHQEGHEGCSRYNNYCGWLRQLGYDGRSAKCREVK